MALLVEWQALDFGSCQDLGPGIKLLVGLLGVSLRIQSPSPSAPPPTCGACFLK